MVFYPILINSLLFFLIIFNFYFRIKYFKFLKNDYNLSLIIVSIIIIKWFD
jgi:hypothetical protein